MHKEKTMKQLLFFAIISAIILTSCSVNEPLVRAKAQNNNTYQIDYLFEHDGCKVYRFQDDGRYIYFTNCTGDVTVAKNDSTETKIQTVIKRK